MADRYQRARWILGNIVETMKDLELWEVAEPGADAFRSNEAFYGDTMSFEQWLRYVLVPRLDEIISERGTFPGGSMLGLKALREYVHFGSLEGADYLVDALQRLDTFVLLLAATATRLRFFEGPREAPPAADRIYADRFSAATTRFVYWHLSLAHAEPSVRFELELEARWFGPSGKEILHQAVVHPLEPGWTASNCWYSYGSDDPGQMAPGEYRVELVLWDQPLIAGHFALT